MKIKRFTRSENGGRAGFIDHIVVLRRDDATNNHENVGSAHILQNVNQLGYKGSMGSSQRRYTDNVNIGVDGLLRYFSRSL